MSFQFHSFVEFEFIESRNQDTVIYPYHVDVGLEIEP